MFFTLLPITRSIFAQLGPVKGHNKGFKERISSAALVFEKKSVLTFDFAGKVGIVGKLKKKLVVTVLLFKGLILHPRTTLKTPNCPVFIGNPRDTLIIGQKTFFPTKNWKTWRGGAKKPPKNGKKRPQSNICHKSLNFGLSTCCKGPQPRILIEDQCWGFSFCKKK